MKTGAELKARREELKITQQDLADKIGVSRTQLSRMENGKIEISSDIYMKIEAALTSNEEYKEPELTINDIQVGDELECIDSDGFINGISPMSNKSILKRDIVISRIENSCAHLVGGSYIRKDEIKYFRKKPKLQFSDLEVGDYAYVRDDLEHGEKYGDRIFVDGMDGMIKGGFIEIHRKYTSWLSNHGFDYTPEMLDISRSMKKEDYLKMNEKEDVSFDDLIDAAVQAKKEGVINHLIIGSSMIDFNYDSDDKNNHFDAEEVEEGIEFIQSLYTEEFVIEKISDELRLKSGAELTLSNGINCVYFDDGDRKLRHDDDFYPCNFLVLKGATVKQSKGTK